MAAMIKQIARYAGYGLSLSSLKYVKTIPTVNWHSININAKRYDLRFCSPIQFPIHIEWWSYVHTHFLQIKQWDERGGCGTQHTPQYVSENNKLLSPSFFLLSVGILVSLFSSISEDAILYISEN